MLLVTNLISRPRSTKWRALGFPATARCLPVMILSILVLAAFPAKAPRWCLMWLLAGAIYVGCKWLNWASSPSRAAPLRKKVAWWLAWPGMDANRFLTSSSCDGVTIKESTSAATKTVFGVGLFILAGKLVSKGSIAAGAWLGMTAFILSIHCGLFHLLSCLWRTIGWDAQPLMNRPLASGSVTDFWGRRWNRAFRDLTYPAIFRPLATRYGPATGTLAVFVFSGLVHELVISVPAGGGFGQPTFYFLLQGVAVLTENQFIENPLRRKHSFAHRTVATIVVAAPLPLLLHPPFVHSVVVPFLKTICP
jgi:membrane bound O-acyltransferase family protein